MLPEVAMKTCMKNIKDKFSLLIDSIPVPETGGAIGLTSCPGKQDEFFFEPSLSRLEADINTIAQWGASIVVTLMECVELTVLQLDNLPAKVVEHGIRWIHLPIRNRFLPDSGFESHWVEVGAELRNTLKDGGKIVIHCQEGIGRTGIVAARLLIEMGIPCNDAVRMVRSARCGALENWNHEAYCNSLRPVI